MQPERKAVAMDKHVRRRVWKHRILYQLGLVPWFIIGVTIGLVYARMTANDKALDDKTTELAWRINTTTKLVYELEDRMAMIEIRKGK